MVVAGAHTVGAPDGGPGLPGTGWSVDHGDLRVPHFVGLHALQALPLFALWLRRRRLPDRVRVRLTGVAAASYAALFGILVWQALRGQSLMSADAAMLTVVAAWALLTGAGAAVAARRRVPPRVHAYV
jgi:putative copper export protein